MRYEDAKNFSNYKGIKWERHIQYIPGNYFVIFSKTLIALMGSQNIAMVMHHNTSP